jgi:electron transfer flavoprotein beta subunit
MKIAVLFKLVPDLVEELEIDEGGKALDTDWLRLIINESDDHAIEQAILLKENSGAEVTIITTEADSADDVLFTAAAKDADTLIKMVGDFDESINNHALARVTASTLKEIQPDLILTGVQAHDDLDGSVGPMLAEFLGMPYVGYVSGVTVSDGEAIVRKEYPGGLIANMKVKLPAVLGIQSAEEPPRYVAVSKVRQAMKGASIEEKDIAELDPSGAVEVERMFQPEVGERATMLGGDEEEVAEKLVEIFKEIGVV